MKDYKKFNALAVSSKFAICGIPIRVDSYKGCTFGCKYCFSNCRKIMSFHDEMQIADLKQLERKLNNIYDKGIYKEDSFIDMLLKERITWHCGALSDPLQPIEKDLKITSGLIDIANKHNVSILFSTKSDTVYDADIRPDLHTFQLSITNIYNRKDIEPGVADIQKRIDFYKYLKKQGFKVGIRIQPYLPGVTSDEIIDIFYDADHFTIEGIKLIPQNKEHKMEMLELLNLTQDDFKLMGLLNLTPELRLKMYKPLLEKLEKYNLSYSIADNDLHYLTTSNICCGDALITKSTKFSNTSLLRSKGLDYSLGDVKDNMGVFRSCRANTLFASNRIEGCKTVEDFFDKRFDRKTSPFSPKFQYIVKK